MRRLPTVFSFALGVVAFVLLSAHSGIVEGYDLRTHNHIVADAVEYMLSAEPTVRYVDGATGKSDYDLLRAVLAPDARDTFTIHSTIRASAHDLGLASAETDLLDDVYLSSCFLRYCWYEVSVADTYFTVFSHFLNVAGSGAAMWPIGGYYYGEVDKTHNCSANENYEDRLGNYLVNHLDARLDVVKSEAVRKYKEPRNPEIKDEEYYKTFDQVIKYIHFWPVTNLANYYYKEFLNRDRNPTANDGQPWSLKPLGYVLHAVADVTVPFHVVGLSGCGHREYEASVERWYVEERRLYDHNLVKNYLASNAVTNHKLVLDTMLIDLARTAVGGNVNVTRIVRDEVTAKKLVNLAIASTVVVIRKSFTDWLNDKTRTRKDYPPVRTAITATPEVKYYASWSDVPEEKAFVTVSNEGKAPLVRERLSNDLAAIKEVVNDLGEGRVSQASFNSRYEIAIDDAAQLISAYPSIQWATKPETRPQEYASMSPVLKSLPQFRLPTLHEIQADKMWESYLEQSGRFYEQFKIYEMGKRQVRLKAILAKNPDDVKAVGFINEQLKASQNAVGVSVARLMDLDIETKLVLFKDVWFEKGKSKLTEEEKAKLFAIAKSLKQSKVNAVLVEGYADEGESSQFNFALGEKRARTVKGYLTKLGVPAEMLQVKSYGKERLTCTDISELCQQLNSRVHLSVQK